MHRAFCFAFAISLTLAAQDKSPITAQAQRGRETFSKSSKGTACATCHAMAGNGTAIGPDLTNMASYAPPRGFVSTMRMSMTEHVVEVKTADGIFPGIQKQKQGDEIEIWDLSQMPPVLRKLAAKDVQSMNRDQKWKHPPAAVEYTSQELADLVAYLKWATTGSRKEIKVDEVE
jgi:cytochrome c1